MRNPKSGCHSIWLGTLSIILLPAALLTVWLGWRTVRNASASLNWPLAQGEITCSEIQVVQDENGATYYANVRYAYVAAGRPFTGSVVYFGQHGGSRERAAAIAGRYPASAVVSVAYDPADPGTAVLEPGADRSSYMVLGIGVLLILAAPLLAAAAAQEWRESVR